MPCSIYKSTYFLCDVICYTSISSCKSLTMVSSCCCGCFCCLLTKYVWYRCIALFTILPFISIHFTYFVDRLSTIGTSPCKHRLLTKSYGASMAEQFFCAFQCMMSLRLIFQFTLCFTIIHFGMNPVPPWALQKAIISPSIASDCANAQLSSTKRMLC